VVLALRHLGAIRLANLVMPRQLRSSGRHVRGIRCPTLVVDLIRVTTHPRRPVRLLPPLRMHHSSSYHIVATMSHWTNLNSLRWRYGGWDLRGQRLKPCRHHPNRVKGIRGKARSQCPQLRQSGVPLSRPLNASMAYAHQPVAL